MTQEELKKFLPHRDNMLLIGEASILNDGDGTLAAVGHTQIRGDEWFLQGHFPGNPVVPGVVLCEIMAQTCSVILADKVKGCTPYFSGLNNVKFKKPVKPGDTLQLNCRILKNKGPFYFAEGTGSVNGTLCVCGEFSFAVKA